MLPSVYVTTEDGLLQISGTTGELYQLDKIVYQSVRAGCMGVSRVQGKIVNYSNI